MAGLSRAAPASGMNVAAGDPRFALNEGERMTLCATPCGKLPFPSGCVAGDEYFAADRNAGQPVLDEQMRAGIQPQIFNIDNRGQEYFLFRRRIFRRSLRVPAKHNRWCARYATP